MTHTHDGRRNRDTDTHVLAGLPHYPSRRLDPAYRKGWRATEQRAGVTVRRRRHSVPARQNALRGALFEGSILAHGLAAPPRTGRVDAVLAQIFSLAGGVTGARIAARHHAPYVPVVQDLMGAAAAQSGIQGGGRAAELAECADSWVLRRATLVGVIHETLAERVRAMGVYPGRIRLVPNWSRIRATSAPRDRTRERLGRRPGQTVVLHSGNMGLKQGLEVLVDAARRDPATRIVLMGDGNQHDHLAALAEGLPNLEFLLSVDGADFPDVMAAADVLAVTRRASVLDMSVPSRRTSYFAAGRPVVASVAAEGGTAREVLRSGAGMLVEPENADQFLSAVRRLAEGPKMADELGATGPRHGAAHLSREAGLARIDALIDEAIGGLGR